MKYYYGNSYKEAISNNPVEIHNTKILEAYKENYNVVFPAKPALPAKMRIKVEELSWGPEDGDELLPTAIGEWMYDTYGHTANSMNMKMSATQKTIALTDIDWNDEEEYY